MDVRPRDDGVPTSASARLAPLRGPRGLGYRDLIRRATGFEGDRRTQLAAAILQGGERCVSPRHTALTSERTCLSRGYVAYHEITATGPELDGHLIIYRK